MRFVVHARHLRSTEKMPGYLLRKQTRTRQTRKCKEHRKQCVAPRRDDKKKRVSVAFFFLGLEKYPCHHLVTTDTNCPTSASLAEIIDERVRRAFARRTLSCRRVGFRILALTARSLLGCSFSFDLGMSLPKRDADKNGRRESPRDISRARVKHQGFARYSSLLTMGEERRSSSFRSIFCIDLPPARSSFATAETTASSSSSSSLLWRAPRGRTVIYPAGYGAGSLTRNGNAITLARCLRSRTNGIALAARAAGIIQKQKSHRARGAPVPATATTTTPTVVVVMAM